MEKFAFIREFLTSKTAETKIAHSLEALIEFIARAKYAYSSKTRANLNYQSIWIL
jgi:hypothetical protein